MRTTGTLAIALSLIVVAAALPCVAGDDEGPGGFPGDVPDRFRLRVGSVLDSFDTNLGVVSDRGAFVLAVNFEDLLGLESTKSTLGVWGSYRLGGRHSLQFSWASSSRDGIRALEREFTFLGYTILAGTESRTEFETEFVNLEYRYDAYDNDEVRLYGSLGVTYLHLKARIATGVGVIGPSGEPLEFGIDRSVDVDTPMPTLGFGADWAVSSRFIAQFYVRAIFAHISDFKGNYGQAGLSGTWFFIRNLGLGIGIDRKDVQIREWDDDDYVVRGSYSQYSAAIFLEAAF
jgi:hypothetical protein